MIDYSLRSCVERGVTVRRCKNCGRWFPQTGRVSAEYCERPVKYGEQRCREIGAFRQWTKKQTDDPIFKAYRKEYKKRFAWIKAGRITDEQFYVWSEQAREEKKKCDREIISLEDFQQWLRESKIWNYAVGKLPAAYSLSIAEQDLRHSLSDFTQRAVFVSQPSAGGYCSIAGWNAMMLRIMPESATMHSPVTPSAMRVHMP